jgi:predicted transcriptional regulator YheO
MTERELIFDHLRQVGDAICALFGPNCETCIHDLTDLQHSLVYINGKVTGRKKGAPATDLLAKLLRQPVTDNLHLHNYKTITGDGRCLKSTTSIIPDSSGKPVAAFCINFDTTDFFNAAQALQPFIFDRENGNGTSRETFAHSASETVEAIFDRAVREIGRQPVTMNVDDKTHLFSILENSGTFEFKGAVEQIAALMGITKYTVYNYLKKIRNNSAKE